MLYNLSNPLDIQSARTRLELLIRRGVVAELKEKEVRRTLSQNAYLHLLLGYFASQTGNTLEWVKQQYYKRTCHPDIFIAEKYDKTLQCNVKYISRRDVAEYRAFQELGVCRGWRLPA